MKPTFAQANDELYANLKWQPEDAFHVLATAWDDHTLYKQGEKQPIPGTGLNQPMLWTTKMGSGRIFVTAMGHDADAMKLPGFIATLTRGAEWAATGEVTIPLVEELRK
jgi:type 1 glutamine amidotransferase